MVSSRVRHYLYRLDKIYAAHRKEKKNYAGKILMAVIYDFSAYWRELEANEFHGLENHETDELYFFFNQKLESIARVHLDFYWLIYDYDEKPIYLNGREPQPFWWGQREQKRRIRKRAIIGKYIDD